jgi:hypothetical protein
MRDPSTSLGMTDLFERGIPAYGHPELAEGSPGA